MAKILTATELEDTLIGMIGAGIGFDEVWASHEELRHLLAAVYELGDVSELMPEDYAAVVQAVGGSNDIEHV